MTTTCQICGRSIKAKSGLIAHHGYTRPYEGHQTSSCYGARHRPYEVACDAIQPVIDRLDDMITRKQAFIDDRLANPPEKLDWVPEYRGYGALPTPKTYDRPEGYVVRDRGTYRPDSYDGAFWKPVYAAMRVVRGATEDVTYLRKRLADWKA